MSEPADGKTIETAEIIVESVGNSEKPGIILSPVVSRRLSRRYSSGRCCVCWRH